MEIPRSACHALFYVSLGVTYYWSRDLMYLYSVISDPITKNFKTLRVKTTGCICLVYQTPWYWITTLGWSGKIFRSSFWTLFACLLASVWPSQKFKNSKTYLSMINQMYVNTLQCTTNKINRLVLYYRMFFPICRDVLFQFMLQVVGTCLGSCIISRFSKFSSF